MTFYRDDLAFIHDSGFTVYARQAAEMLVFDLRQQGHTRGLVVELGCGSGVLSQHMSLAGYDVLGIDQSAAFIATAQARVPAGWFRVGSVWKEDLPACVAVAAVGEVFNYLFDPDHSLTELEGLLARIQAALAPGGTLLFDISEPGRVPGPGPAQFNRDGEGWACLATSTEDATARLLTRRIVTFRKVGQLYRRDEETHVLRLLPRAELAQLLSNAGFDWQFLDGYGPQRLPVGMVAVLARR
jgi:SAM-dependent methyltransferase